MPSFQDSAVLVLLALLLFGPKKLPVLARQLGKLMADFRRASNEFRGQMEEELRISEQAERQKQVAAIAASAPANSIAAPIPEPEHPHLPKPIPEIEIQPELASSYDHEPLIDLPELTDSGVATTQTIETPETGVPLPIATSGELSILPPATGLPIANGSAHASSPHTTELETETLHG
jgi:sec-independent protein translocase protein TatB